MFALALALSLLGLALGPLLVLLGQNRSRLAALVDGLTLGVVPPVIVLRLLPHLYEEAGLSAIVLFAAGFGLSWLVEHRTHRDSGIFTSALLLPTLSLHSLLDGAALSVAFASQNGATPLVLGLALVLHRLPEGLIFASHLFPRVGTRGTIVRTVVLGAATIVGALGGRELLSLVPDAILHGVVAIGLGALLRLLVHRHDAPAAPRSASPLWAGLSFLGGLGLILAIPEPHPVLAQATPGELSVLRSLGPLFLETAPAMLAATALKGLLSAASLALGESDLAPPHPPSPVIRALLGCRAGRAAGDERAGSALPRAQEGDLGDVPEMVSLDVSGLALSFEMLGAGFTAWRLGAGLLVAAAAARAVRGDRSIDAPRAPERLSGAPTRRGIMGWRRLARLLDPAVAREGAAYLCGLAAAAALEASVDSMLLPRLGIAGAVLLAPAVALLFVPPAAFGVPLAAVLLHKGAPTGLLVGLAVAVPALRGLLPLRRGAAPRLAPVALVVCGAFATGALSQLTLGSAGPPFHEFAAHRHGAAEWICALLFALLLVQSVARRGPRSWFLSPVVTTTL